MARTHRNVLFTLEHSIYHMLKQYSEETGIPMSRIVERAVVEYISRRTSQQRQ